MSSIPTDDFDDFVMEISSVGGQVGFRRFIRIDRIYRLGFAHIGKVYISSGSSLVWEFTMMEEIERLVERFESLKEGERNDAASILKKYAEGEMELEELRYILLDEGLIPMPSRCTMYHKPEESPEAEEALRRLIKEKISGR